MKAWAVALCSILAGTAVALGVSWRELGGIAHQFEPHSGPASWTPDLDGSGGTPRAVVVGGAEYDFGAGQREAKIEHVFKVRNDGTAPLRLDKGSTSCKCTLSELVHSSVLPGESCDVKLEVKLTAGGKRTRQTAEIHTNDPTNPTLVFTVIGGITDIVRVDPTELSLQRLSASEGGQAEFRVFAYTTSDFKIERYECTGRTSPADKFEVKFEPLPEKQVREELGAKAGLRGKLIVKSGLPLGPLGQTIRLVTNVPNATEREITITGSVVSDISVLGGRDYDDEHSLLKFGTVTSGEGIRTNLRILVKGPLRQDVKLSVKETDPPGILAAKLGEPQDINQGAVRMYPLAVEVVRGARAVDCLGLSYSKLGRVVIETTHPIAKTINVYVRFAVK